MYWVASLQVLDELFGSDLGQLQNAAERSGRQLAVQRDNAADRAFGVSLRSTMWLPLCRTLTKPIRSSARSARSLETRGSLGTG